MRCSIPGALMAPSTSGQLRRWHDEAERPMIRSGDECDSAVAMREPRRGKFPTATCSTREGQHNLPSPALRAPSQREQTCDVTSSVPYYHESQPSETRERTPR